MGLGKLHVEIQKNWSAEGRSAHYVVWSSAVRPHRIKIDEEEGSIIMTHELGMFMVSHITLPLRNVLQSLVFLQTSNLLGTPLWACVSWIF